MSLSLFTSVEQEHCFVYLAWMLMFTSLCLSSKPLESQLLAL